MKIKIYKHTYLDGNIMLFLANTDMLIFITPSPPNRLHDFFDPHLVIHRLSIFHKKDCPLTMTCIFYNTTIIINPNY